VVLLGLYGVRNQIDKVALQNEVPENVWPAPNEDERRGQPLTTAVGTELQLPR
jgi:hypothetical protein